MAELHLGKTAYYSSFGANCWLSYRARAIHEEEKASFRKINWFGFFFRSKKPARQNGSMHEENIYADEERGLFKSRVKEQLFCSSILM